MEMPISRKTQVAAIRFAPVGKLYHFDASDIPDLQVGDHVVVETSRGRQLGQVARFVEGVDPQNEGLKQIERKATPRDLVLRQTWQSREPEVVSVCKVRAEELRLHGVKIVAAEFSYDGARLTILFGTETEEKADLKSLRQDMQRAFAPSQVELRQIGPRDVAKTLCGMGACGLEKRCCCMFLTEFSSISIRMAKEQSISLTPSEITGMCGRLRCCLIYEYDTYVAARQSLPRRNTPVQTPQGPGRVVDIAPLREGIVVELAEGGRREFPRADVILLDGSQPIPEKPAEPEVEETTAKESPLPVQPTRFEARPPRDRDDRGRRPGGERPNRPGAERTDRPADTDRGGRPQGGPDRDRSADRGPQRGSERGGGQNRPGGPAQPGERRGGGNPSGQPSRGSRPNAPESRGQKPADGPRRNRPPRPQGRRNPESSNSQEESSS